MKQLLLASFVILASCNAKNEPADTIKSNNDNPLKDIHLMDCVDHGLHQITINDSTTVLLYRGTESCTMIQLK